MHRCAGGTAFATRSADRRRDMRLLENIKPS
jgi:hypothetical protein